ncbi:MAG: ParA family protein [Betaproteobacteria bacterium]
MQTILIANPKGGSGKTTLATNIAGWLAGKRQRVALLDEDPQRSTSQWLARRPALFPPIAGFTDASGKKELKHVAPDWLVIDSPAGLHGEALRDALRRADAMIVPVSPSAFDMAATQQFFANIAGNKVMREGELPIALVAMRVDSRTNSATELDDFLKELKLPVVAHLRTTQIYVRCARDGLSVFDLPRSRGEQDQEQWRPLTRWIARHAAVRSG